MKDLELWYKIQQFQFDDGNSEFTFSMRLARENGWNQEYTLAVLEEYRRFIYLCCISDTPITPSDPVDQAWHLHLTYTQSYWVSLCKETIGQMIHHGPTKGGVSEGKKFKDWYKLTFDIYSQEFGHKVPESIWWDSSRRFKEIHFTRVNRQKNWVIAKPSFKLLKSMLLSLVLFSCLVFLSSADGAGASGVMVIMALAILVILFVAKGGGKGGKGGSGSGGWFGCGSSGCGSSGCGSGCGGGGCGGCGN